MPVFERAAILSTGTEILQGLYADTNARYLAERLSAMSLQVVAIAAAPDDADEMEKTFRHLVSRSDIVICSGGLGPTEDDVNRDVFSRVFNVPLVRDDDAVENMRERFSRRGRQMPSNNEVQAMVPKGSTVFQNEWGTAPGFFFHQEGKAAVVALPGPPNEMIPMFEKHVEPLLCGCVGERCVKTTTIHTFGLPESLVNEKVRELFRADPEVIYTVLAKTYGVDIRITPRKGSAEETDIALAHFIDETRRRIGEEWIYGHNNTRMQDAVAELLIRHEMTVTAAESCTGGLVAKLLTDVSGSSAYLMESYVTYSNDAKTRLLDVPAEILAEHGAVSEPVALQMATGARERSGADIAVAITGIAGPTGGTAEKPVGLTYVALSTRDHTAAQKFQLIGNRDLNRLHAAQNALNMIRLELLKGRK